jgi:imidazolonepropionase-like amidohydrolase
MAIVHLSFALLMALELATALAFGQSPAQFLSAITTPAGALGLAGQIGFAVIPLFRQARG